MRGKGKEGRRKLFIASSLNYLRRWVKGKLIKAGNLSKETNKGGRREKER